MPTGTVFLLPITNFSPTNFVSTIIFLHHHRYIHLPLLTNKNELSSILHPFTESRLFSSFHHLFSLFSSFLPFSPFLLSLLLDQLGSYIPFGQYRIAGYGGFLGSYYTGRTRSWHEEPEHRDQNFVWRIVCARLSAYTKFRLKCSGSACR